MRLLRRCGARPKERQSSVSTFKIEIDEQLAEANEVVGDAEAMRERLNADGYLFLRQVIDTEATTKLRRELLGILAEHGFAEPGNDDVVVWTGKQPSSEDTIHAEIRTSPHWQEYVEHPSMRRVVELLFGEPAFWLNNAIHRYNPPSRTLDDPSRPGGRPPVHQDDVGLYGIERVLTFWNPLVEIDEAMGGMAVARQTHRLGMLFHDPTLMIPVEDITEMKWMRAHYQPGDVLILLPSTVHTGLPNHAENQIRLSLDCRAMPESDERPDFLGWSSKKSAEFTRRGREVLQEENVPRERLQDMFWVLRDRDIDPEDRDAVRSVIKELAAA